MFDGNKSWNWSTEMCWRDSWSVSYSEFQLKVKKTQTKSQELKVL